MSLVELSVKKLLQSSLLLVVFYLSCQLLQVLKIVLLSHFLVVSCHDVLLLLVPFEFFSLVFADFLDSVAFLHEAFVGLGGDLL